MSIHESRNKGFDVLDKEQFYQLTLERPVQGEKKATSQVEADEGDITKLLKIFGVNHVIGGNTDNELILIGRDVTKTQIDEVLGMLSIKDFKELSANPFKRN